MSLGQIFKAVTNQRPEPWKEREATDELIQQLTDRVRELMEQNEALHKDAERGRYMIDNGCWHRGEEQTHLAVLVPQGSDLSCYATRRAAIDKAMEAK